MNNTNAPPSCRKKKLACWLSLIALLALLGAAVWFAYPYILKMRGDAPGAAQEKWAEIDQRLQALDTKLGDLSQRVEAAKTDGHSETAQQSAEAVTRLQSDLTALSALVSGLQTEMRQTGANAQTQQATLASMASAIAFLQLRDTAQTGRNFTAELSTLRQASKTYPALQEKLNLIEPHAAQGAPMPDALRETFINLEPAVLQAIGKATAQNWWERFLAVLRGLISIRPVHGGSTNDALTAAETALAKGDVAAALESTKSLPTEAQEVLKDWRAQAEARQQVNAVLQALAHEFAGLATTAKSNAQGEP
ncbi:MAG: hypothetical protein SFW62_04735 [Alphaproteobacteria bacterium]|nr:hypothetical protein [Alphaproteobacteria bacterium]